MMRWWKLCLFPSPAYVFIYSKFHALVSIITINQQGKQLNVGRKWGFLVLTWDSPLQLQSGVHSPVSPLPNLPCSVLYISFISYSVLANLCWISPSSDEGQGTYRGVDLWISTSCREAISNSSHSILFHFSHGSFLFSGFLFFFNESWVWRELCCTPGTWLLLWSSLGLLASLTTERLVSIWFF